MFGACRRNELVNLKINNVQDDSKSLKIYVEDTKKDVDRSFTVIGECYDICKKYMNLRPNNTTNNRFFLYYNNGKCSRQPIGINKLGRVTNEAAAWLGLQDPNL